ncbi:MAG: cysteate synthase [Acidobacteria bacterium]|nr:MAG: cysteate synthase [Acidobacteriota bacterium]
MSPILGTGSTQDSPASLHYKLSCNVCGANYHDNGLMLDCANVHDPSLLVTDYVDKRFSINEEAEGIYRYERWLPIRRRIPGSYGPVTYRSKRLSRLTGLPNLWIAFNGYWPEKGAHLETASFKELEAHTVLSRVAEHNEGILVIASAGNTAAAFARACSVNHIACLIIVPTWGLQKMRFCEPLDSCVKIVSLTGSTDYYDVITMAERVARLQAFYPEGGVRNVARRDGLGTTLLNAAETIGQLPDFYFQAIGSGAGAIAAHEAGKRLIKDGRFGHTLPRLMLSQNLPFVPIYLSWKSLRHELIEVNSEDGKEQIKQIGAHVLSNRRPPYAVRGGVCDILRASRGDMLVADNLEAQDASRLFEESEGIDIDPAGAVAFATLLKVARCDQIERDAHVLLHITGGGWRRRSLDHRLVSAHPELQFDETQILAQETLDKVAGLFC